MAKPKGGGSQQDEHPWRQYPSSGGADGGDYDGRIEEAMRLFDEFKKAAQDRQGSYKQLWEGFVENLREIGYKAENNQRGVRLFPTEVKFEEGEETETPIGERFAEKLKRHPFGDTGMIGANLSEGVITRALSDDEITQFRALWGEFYHGLRRIKDAGYYSDWKYEMGEILRHRDTIIDFYKGFSAYLFRESDETPHVLSEEDKEYIHSLIFLRGWLYVVREHIERVPGADAHAWGMDIDSNSQSVTGNAGFVIFPDGTTEILKGIEEIETKFADPDALEANLKNAMNASPFVYDNALSEVKQYCKVRKLDCCFDLITHLFSEFLRNVKEETGLAEQLKSAKTLGEVREVFDAYTGLDTEIQGMKRYFELPAIAAFSFRSRLERLKDFLVRKEGDKDIEAILDARLDPQIDTQPAKVGQEKKHGSTLPYDNPKLPVFKLKIFDSNRREMWGYATLLVTSDGEGREVLHIDRFEAEFPWQVSTPSAVRNILNRIGQEVWARGEEDGPRIGSITVNPYKIGTSSYNAIEEMIKEIAQETVLIKIPEINDSDKLGFTCQGKACVVWRR